MATLSITTTRRCFVSLSTYLLLLYVLLSLAFVMATIQQPTSKLWYLSLRSVLLYGFLSLLFILLLLYYLIITLNITLISDNSQSQGKRTLNSSWIPVIYNCLDFNFVGWVIHLIKNKWINLGFMVKFVNKHYFNNSNLDGWLLKINLKPYIICNPKVYLDAVYFVRTINKDKN